MKSKCTQRSQRFSLQAAGMGSISLKADLKRTTGIIYAFFLSPNTFHIYASKTSFWSLVPDIFIWMVFKNASRKKKITCNLPKKKKKKVLPALDRSLKAVTSKIVINWYFF